MRYACSDLQLHMDKRSELRQNWTDVVHDLEVLTQSNKIQYEEGQGLPGRLWGHGYSLKWHDLGALDDKDELSQEDPRMVSSAVRIAHRHLVYPPRY